VDTWPPKPATGQCGICEAIMHPFELIPHVRREHPEYYDPVQCWPDGRPVIVDTTLDPDDFL